MNKQQPDIQLSYDCATPTPTFTVFFLPSPTDIYNMIVTSKYSTPSKSLPYKVVYIL